LGGTSPVFWRFVLYVVLTEVIQVCAIKKEKKRTNRYFNGGKLRHLPAHQAQQQQRVPQRGQLQTIIRRPAVFPRWLAKYHSKDTARNIAALHVCIFIQKCCKMIEKTV
jgi:hypothetical protein